MSELHTLLEAMPHAAMVVAMDDEIVAANRAMQRILHDGPDPGSHRLVSVVAPDMEEGIEAAICDALELGLSSCLSPALGPPGGTPREIDVVALGDGRCLVQVRDAASLLATERRLSGQDEEIAWLRRELGKRERDAARAVYVDVGTGLQNRQAFSEHLRRALARAAHGAHLGAVALIDIDNFTDLNESLGPSGADEVLREVGARIGSAMRDVDTVARYGGDVFAVLIDGIARPEDGMAAALRASQAVGAPIAVRGSEVYATVGIGVSVYPMDGLDPDRLLRNAETALARAKEAGGDNVQLYSARLNRRAEERLSLAAALRRAVETMEAFEMHFQPQVEIASGRIVGAEALLRWNDPERGGHSPAVFIPILEETGLIGRVGAWALESSCQSARTWDWAGAEGATISVNVSAKQFHSGDLLGSVRRTLEQTGLPPASLELELTESLLIEDLGRSAQILRSLERMGIKIAVDDFGTGYSSLSYLKRFPVDTLKIDRAFVRDLDHDAEDQAICRAIIKLGHELGMKVVGEGVETEAQLSALEAYGCDIVQGYYFSRPVPAPQFREWAARHAPPLSSVG